MAKKLSATKKDYFAAKISLKMFLFAGKFITLGDGAGALRHPANLDADVEDKRLLRTMQTHELLRKLFEASDDLYFEISGADLVVTFAAATTRQDFGINVPNLIGRQVAELLHPDDFRAFVEYLAHPLQPGQVFDFSARFFGENGQARSADLVVVVLALDDRGAPTLAMIARSPLGGCSNGESAERLRAVIETAVDGIITINERGRIETVNPAAIHIFGYSADEIIGQNVNVLMPEPYHREHDSYLDNYLRTGNKKIIGIGREVTGKRKDGSTFPVDLAVSESRIGPRRVFTGIVRDISPRKQAEEELRQLNETLEQRVAERTAEAEDRAVQLRRLALELTQVEARERRRLAETLHDHLQQLVVGAKLQIAALQYQPDIAEPVRLRIAKIAKLLDETIAVSRNLTAELRPPVLYEGGLEAALKWLGNWMEDKYGLTVNIQESDTVRYIHDDVKALLFQCVRELLFNIVKHAGVQQATIALSTSPNGDLTICCQDDGLGFDPTAATSPGFGLFSIRERIKSLGGNMTIDSAPGHGTKVAIVVPRHVLSGRPTKTPKHERERDSSSSDTRRILPPRASVITVLLVDDHKIVREGVASMLASERDIEIVGEASNGREAIYLAEKLRPDLIMMDVNMPVMNGIFATRQIKARLPDVRIVGLSVHDDTVTADEMRTAGAEAMVDKGRDSAALVKTIRCVIASDRSASDPSASDRSASDPSPPC